MNKPCPEAFEFFTSHDVPNGVIKCSCEEFIQETIDWGFKVGPISGSGQAFGVLLNGHGVWCEIGESNEDNG